MCDPAAVGRNSCSFVDFDPSSQRFLVSYRSDEARALPRYLVINTHFLFFPSFI